MNADDGRSGTQEDQENLASDELLGKLRAALRMDGDFPASAKIVSELRQLTSDPRTTANQITEVILREPSLGTRVLHLVNSAFYRRSKPIMTVSQAVVQIGMRPLAELCAGLVLLQKFVPAARRGGSFANCLRKSVLTSLLASSITDEAARAGDSGGKNQEFGYLAGSFHELGTLLLAYYFPQVYETAVKRSDTKKQDLGRSLREITGLSPVQLSLEVVDALQLPPFYRDVLLASDPGITPSPDAVITPDVKQISNVVGAASDISDVVVSGKSKQEMDKVMGATMKRYGLEQQLLNKVVSELPTLFKDHCSSIDLQLPSLPEFVMSYSTPEGAGGSKEESPAGAKDSENQFTQFVTEIRQAVENREPTASIITSVMETCAWSLKFDRVLLLLLTNTKTRMVGRMLLGNVPNFDPKEMSRSVGSDSDSFAPDTRAFRESRPVFNGEPLFADGWPLAVIPVGFGQRAIGVIYADRAAQPKPGNRAVKELTSREQAAMGILAELLDRSISINS